MKMENLKDKTPQKPFIMDIEAIKKVLPHRYPFLLVDRVVEMSEKRIVGIKNVTANEPFFQGHFPERPVMPGVLIVEALAQVGGISVLATINKPGQLAYLISVNNARFRKTVVPGDQLRLEVDIIKLKSKLGIVKGVAKVAGEEVCDAEIMFALVD
jgi:3-hydroxyacyl-[acyl-carrier-protein] dehydratase